MAYITLKDKLQIYYEILGPQLDVSSNSDQDVKTLLFIHGAPGLVDTHMYSDFWGRFASDKLRIFFYEQRGSGRSDDCTLDKLNITQHVADLHEFCQTLNIQQPILTGVSYGGYISLAYASQYPNQVTALILCNTNAKRETDERVAACYKSLIEYFGKTAADAKTISEKLRVCDANWDANWDADNYKLFINLYSKNSYKPQEIAQCQQHPMTWQKFMTDEFGTFDLTADLGNITCPVLYLVGEYDWIHPPICSERTAKLMRNAQVEKVMIKNTGDPIYRDQPQITEQIIRKFISKIL
jgi:proline iminopeptidase